MLKQELFKNCNFLHNQNYYETKKAPLYSRAFQCILPK